MAEFIKFKEKKNHRTSKFIVNHRRTLIIILSVLLVVVLGFAIYLVIINRDNTPKYKNTLDILTAGMSEKLGTDYKNYDKLLKEYDLRNYQNVIDEAKKSLDNGLSDELISSYYYLIINSYVGLGDIKSAEDTVNQFKKTNSYSKLDDESKRILDVNIELAKKDKEEAL